MNPILHYYNTLVELHGITKEKDLMSRVAKQYGVSYQQVYELVKSNNIDVKYGIIIGRFQPFHYGHQHIINEVLLDGRIPIICLGDDYGKDEKRNPLTFNQRKYLIKTIYTNQDIIFKRIYDNDDWTKWFEQFLEITKNKDISLYYNNKEPDRYDHFECQGKKYTNDFYTQIFKENNIKTTQIEFVERNDIHVDADASNIRENLEEFKHLLDARIYWKLKSWGWQ